MSSGPDRSFGSEMVFVLARADPALAKKIDAMAKRAKVAVLSTGVNPGFVMDALPIMLTVACERVESVTVNGGPGYWIEGGEHSPSPKTLERLADALS